MQSGIQNRRSESVWEKSRTAVASFLQRTVSDQAGNAMTAKGVAEERAEVDTVFHWFFQRLC